MSREKQIEEMKLIIDKAEEEYSEIWNEWFYDHKEGTKIDNEFLFFAKMLYDAGYRKQSEWISVEDRLPERLGRYLAYTTRGTIEIARFYPYYVNDKPQFDYWIAYWMPLPEPPEMKGE